MKTGRMSAGSKCHGLAALASHPTPWAEAEVCAEIHTQPAASFVFAVQLEE
jgi:hypothetical protein